MLKQMLTGVAVIFAGLLSSVRGDEGLSESQPSDDSLANLIVSFKENCPEYQDPLFCLYWYSSDLTDIHSPQFFKSKATAEATRGNKLRGKDTQGKDSLGTFAEFPEDHLQKRFLMARRKTPTARGYKRGPGFRSWGGKRDSVPNWQNVDKRSKFGPWGGKRDEEYLSDDLSSSDPEEWAEKRAKFQNWGGKRSTNDFAGSQKFFDLSIKREPNWKDRGFYLSEPFKKAVPKRPQFQSWGGKRAPNPWHKIFEFLNARSPGYSVIEGEKRKFSSWGGKRYENNDEDVVREAFQNWEGQRVSSERDSYAEGTSSPKKSASHDNAMQISTITTAAQHNWKNGEPSLISNAWREKGREEGNTR